MPRCKYMFQLRSKNGKAINVSKKRSELSLQEILEIENLGKIIIFPGIMFDVKNGVTADFKEIWTRKVQTPISRPSAASLPKPSIYRNPNHDTGSYPLYQK